MASRDSILVSRVRRGDVDAFTMLDAMYRDVAHQQAQRIVGNEFEADDVVQEAMYRAYVRIDQLANASRFGSWLKTIVRNVAIDHLRVRFRRNEHSFAIEDLDTLSTIEKQSHDSSDALEIDGKIVSQLSPVLAEVVTLRFVEGLKIAEIASRLDVPMGTVKRRLHDAKHRIRRIRMTVFHEKAAWSIVDAAKSEIEALPVEVLRDILGIAVGGDLPRNEFLSNNSALLICTLFSNRESLNLYETTAYRAVTEVFDKLCGPYQGCAESPAIWENLATDGIYLPTSMERFTPPRIPQPQWYSMYLFDLIDHHHMIYGDDFIAPLYRPDPRSRTLRMAAEVLRLLQSGKASPRPLVGFGTVVHWQALKMVRVLQLHFAPGEPTIERARLIENYHEFVPEFSTKRFGIDLFLKDMNMQYPADRVEYSEDHADGCRTFIYESCDLLMSHSNRLA